MHFRKRILKKVDLRLSKGLYFIFLVAFFMIKEETSALIDSSVKPNSGYSWIHHFHKVSLTDDINPSI